MFHLPKTTAARALVVGMAALSVVVAAAGAGSGSGGSAPAPASSVAELARPSESECRASNQAIDAKIQRLRQSCELELQEFAACRASRPEWSSVELFSCGFEMSTSLAKGDVEDPATLEDCGTSAPAVASAESRAQEPLRPGKDCPVPACEAELEALQVQKADRAPLKC